MARPLSVLAVLLALVVAGCGGGGDDKSASTSKQDYTQQLTKATAALQTAFGQIADATSQSKSAKDIGRQLDQGSQALSAAAGDFADIQPPAQSRAAHLRLVEGLRELAAVFHRAAQAAQRGDTKALTTALAGLGDSAAVKKISDAQAQLKAQGIEVATTTSTTGS